MKRKSRSGTGVRDRSYRHHMGGEEKETRKCLLIYVVVAWWISIWIPNDQIYFAHLPIIIVTESLGFMSGCEMRAMIWIRVCVSPQGSETRIEKGQNGDVSFFIIILFPFKHTESGRILCPIDFYQDRKEMMLIKIAWNVFVWIRFGPKGSLEWETVMAVLFVCVRASVQGNRNGKTSKNAHIKSKPCVRTSTQIEFLCSSAWIPAKTHRIIVLITRNRKFLIWFHFSVTFFFIFTQWTIKWIKLKEKSEFSIHQEWKKRTQKWYSSDDPLFLNCIVSCSFANGFSTWWHSLVGERVFKIYLKHT